MTSGRELESMLVAASTVMLVLDHTAPAFDDCSMLTGVRPFSHVVHTKAESMSRVVHFEIHATNPEPLVAFYTSLFGWEIQKWGGPMDYYLISTGPAEKPGINGGLLKRHGGAPIEGQAVSSFVCTVDVDSAKVSLDRAVELGGTVALPIMPVPGIGWLCYAKDPDGNIFGMMQNDPAAA